MSDQEIRFGALCRLYGTEGCRLIRNAHVAVIGLGGVGSWAVEALARSGVGQLTLVDLDEICLSNVNRQVHAMDGAIGRAKAHAMADRIKAISPDCEVRTEVCFFTETTADRLLSVGYEWVVDAIDATKHKCLLIAEARRRNQALLTCGGAGGRIDPTRIQVTDLARTKNDPLLLEVRKRLRRDFGFPKYSRQKFGIDCVYTDEPPVFPQPDGTVALERIRGEDYRLNCDAGFGSAATVTGSIGLILAAEVLRRIAENGGQS